MCQIEGLVALSDGEGLVQLSQVAPACSFRRPKALEVIEYFTLLLSMSTLILLGIQGQPHTHVNAQSQDLASITTRLHIIKCIFFLLLLDVIGTFLWLFKCATTIAAVKPRLNVNVSQKLSLVDSDAVGSTRNRPSTQASSSSSGHTTSTWLRPAVVIDSGSSMCRFGFGTAVAKPRG